METAVYLSLREKSRSLKPGNGTGFVQILWTLALTSLGIFLSFSKHWPVWLSGQVLLAIPLFQWFVLLHEAGHETLFRTKALNLASGLLASVFCLIPFSCWKKIHKKHHVYTGWQDLDPTTQSLVPRPLSLLEKFLVNISWKLWFPLFSILYRFTNYWNFPRLWKMFPKPKDRAAFVLSAAFIAAVVILSSVLMGMAFLKVFALSFFLHLVLSDPILLSQHTHIPQKIAKGKKVPLIKTKDQDIYTRSLGFPRWVSQWVFYYFDAHEIHHAFPAVPGFLLGRFRYRGENEVSWFRFVRETKKIPASVFLFQNRNDTGLKV